MAMRSGVVGEREASLVAINVHPAEDELGSPPLIAHVEEKKDVVTAASLSGATCCGRRVALRSGLVQVILVAAANFATMGMWNSLNGIGGLGTGDTQMASYCNMACYLAGIYGGVLAGGAINVVGVRVAALVGIFMQVTGIVSYWMYHYRGVINLAAVTAYAVVWGSFVSWYGCATGTVLVHYPTERERNRFISIVSIFLNVGGMIGGIISLIMNFDSGRGAVSDGGETGLSEPSYLAMIGISATGLLFAVFLVDYQKVVRSDNTVPQVEKNRMGAEIKNLVKGFTDPTLWLLVPLFLSVLWHEVVLFSYMNSELANVRTRAFNSCLYYVGRIIAAPTFHKIVDLGGENLKKKLILANVVIGAFILLAIVGSLPIFFGAYAINKSKGNIDFTEGKSTFFVISFLTYGGLETLWCNYVYWVVGVLPIGDANAKNRYIGWHRSFTSMGGMLAWMLDAIPGIPILVQWFINLTMWVLGLVGVMIAYRRTAHRAPDSVPSVLLEDMRGSILITGSITPVGPWTPSTRRGEHQRDSSSLKHRVSWLVPSDACADREETRASMATLDDDKLAGPHASPPHRRQQPTES